MLVRLVLVDSFHEAFGWKNNEKSLLNDFLQEGSGLGALGWRTVSLQSI